MSDTTAEVKAILAAQEAMQAERTSWEAHWADIARYMIPEMEDQFNGVSDAYNLNRGDKKHTEIFDSTAIQSFLVYVAILESMLTPRSQTWHRLRVADQSLRGDREVGEWLDQVSRILFDYRYAPMANFSEQVGQVYASLGAFGTGALYVDFVAGSLRYKGVPLGELFIQENHQGVVDYVHRKFALTARQAVQQFGDAVSADIKKDAERPSAFSRRYEFLQCIKPDDTPGSPFAFRSVYVDPRTERVLREGGYYTFPLIVTRDKVFSGDMYGRSPAMAALPDIKTANEMMKTLLKQGQLALHPMLLTHDDGVMSISARPGAIVSGGVSADGRPLVLPLAPGNVNVGIEMLTRVQQSIQRAFMVHVFQIMVEGSSRMTATEVMERAFEKGALLAPAMGRQQSELLGPMIQREVDLLLQAGVLPPMPEQLMEVGGGFSVVYESPLTQSQRANEASGLMRLSETLTMISSTTGNPEVWDFLDTDAVVPGLATVYGIPVDFVRDRKEVQAMRAARSGQVQQQQAVDALPGVAALIKAQGSAT